MKKIAQFEKISLEQFEKDYVKLYGSSNSINSIYNDIKLPLRATIGSAGYDFYLPFDFKLKAGDTAIVPTGIRVKMQEDWVLQIFPRSSLGFKFSLMLNNTVGIIDSDYYYSDNEGHILIKLTNNSIQKLSIELNAGSAFAQGIFFNYGITTDDNATQIRNGGFGSTNNAN
ncbi:MAG: deoxyuridine 5'-triphosphate nucleotidohydrolase [Clostridiales bacterium]|nr:deoxyuridine 5'-triphosphate nucleotidohydrolase [Clostridiales bacterium]